MRSVAAAWFGSTFGCAECHDHKFDPIKTRDFYELLSFFADVKQWGVYQDYGYSKNPDLVGFTNDHPFPPEIEVESPYLRLRHERATAELQAHVGALDSSCEPALAPGAPAGGHPDGSDTGAIGGVARDGDVPGGPLHSIARAQGRAGATGSSAVIP